MQTNTANTRIQMKGVTNYILWSRFLLLRFGRTSLDFGSDTLVERHLEPGGDPLGTLVAPSSQPVF